MNRLFSFSYLLDDPINGSGYSEKYSILRDGTWVIDDLLIHTEKEKLTDGVLLKTAFSIIPPQTYPYVTQYITGIREWDDRDRNVEQKKILLAAPYPFACIQPIGNTPYVFREKILFIQSLFGKDKKSAIFSSQIENGTACRGLNIDSPSKLRVRTMTASKRDGEYYRLTDLAFYFGRYPSEIWEMYEPFYHGEQILLARSPHDAQYGECILLASGTHENLARHATTEEPCTCVLHNFFGDSLLHSIWIPYKWGEIILKLETLKKSSP